MEINEYRELEKLALEIATKAHEGQYDKAGKPYIEHPINVASYLVHPKYKVVALLHDVVEDTNITIEDLHMHGFTEEITNAINLLTRQKNENYFKYIERIKPNKIARAVKLADLTHNMDLSRLKEITPKDEERIQKYTKAVEYLTQK